MTHPEVIALPSLLYEDCAMLGTLEDAQMDLPQLYEHTQMLNLDCKFVLVSTYNNTTFKKMIYIYIYTVQY